MNPKRMTAKNKKKPRTAGKGTTRTSLLHHAAAKPLQTPVVPLHPPPEYKRLKQFTAAEIGETFSSLMMLESEALEALAVHPKARGLERVVARVLIEAWKSGDTSRIDDLLNRVIGKVGDNLTVTTKDDVELERFKKLSPEERAKELAQLREVIGYKLERDRQLNATISASREHRVKDKVDGDSQE